MLEQPLFAMLSFLLLAGGPASIESWSRVELSLSHGKAPVRPRLAPRVAPPPATIAFADLCRTRLAAGPGGMRDGRLDLSAAHALVREFSAESAFAPSDTALAAALQDDEALGPAGLPVTLETYAAALRDVCAAPASSAALGPVRVVVDGTVARVRPGTGAVAYPTNVQVVVIDLRDLPEVGGLRAAITAAIAPALRNPVSGQRWARCHDGPVQEAAWGSSVYSTTLDAVDESLPATGSRDLPIVLLTGARMAPTAGRVAAMLRAAGRAWIAGAALATAVAESEWQGVGAHGLAVRTSMLADPVAVQHDVLRGIAVQDDPWDPANAAYRSVIGLDDDARTLAIDVTAGATTDVDLYVLHDADGDGLFAFPDEVVGLSTSPTAHERVVLGGDQLAPGRYEILVHGYSVPFLRTPVTVDVTQGTVLPDTLPADLPSSLVDPLDAVKLKREVTGTVPPRITGSIDRRFPILVDPSIDRMHPSGQSRGELRAALLAAHGVVRLFFRYFPVVGDTIDDRLLETLAAADALDGSDRIAAWRVLRRFGEALHDGHQSVISDMPLFATILPVWFEHVDGRPVVRRSAVAGIAPGDTVVALDGRPIEQVYAEELERTSAASPGLQRHVADDAVFAMNGPITLQLEGADGTARTLIAAPQPLEAYLDVVQRGVSDRPSGPLTDLGRGDIAYLNLNAFTSPQIAQVRAALGDATARGARGLVVDMRGYPAANTFDVAARLIREPFLSPMYVVTGYQGAARATISTTQFSLAPRPAPAFDGPIVLLTGPHAVSAAENFMQMLMGARRPLAVVGQSSAGTNGNMTALSLPGGFLFTYTGMEVRNPDGSRFHGIGIVPDVGVPVTATDLRDGIDRDLVTALSLFPPAAP